MAFLEGKTPTEKKKIAAAAVLGLVALVALYLAFGRGGSSTTTAKSSPTPRPSQTPRNTDDRQLPTVSEQDFVYQTTPIVYSPSGSGAPDPGRNIFAFYEPPPPTPYSPTPVPTVKLETPTPTPVPPFDLRYINPQTIYAGSQGFRLEVNGDKFTPDARIYFNQNELPTSFVSSQKLTTDIPASFITQEGPRQVIVQTTDGKSYSLPTMWMVQAPPRPTFQYIGAFLRARQNNNTAVLKDQGKEFSARLNDVVGGRFRLINITAAEVTFEDVSLGFKHRIPLSRAGTSAGTGSPYNPGMPSSYPTYDPSMNQPNLPGVPSNVPRYVPPQPQPKRTPSKDEDVDDNDDGDGR